MTRWLISLLLQRILLPLALVAGKFLFYLTLKITTILKLLTSLPSLRNILQYLIAIVKYLTLNTIILSQLSQIPRLIVITSKM